MTWTTRDGQILEINEMTTGHLVNTIKYLETHFGCTSDSYDKFPASTLKAQLKEMKEVLASRITEQHNLDELERKNNETVINPFEFI